ncbi:glycosyltransferase [Rhodobacteraceae bacterium CCMM004]|nr:glycosyltransferase [Rhodobacteraceae bacterium CCMM004]
MSAQPAPRILPGRPRDRHLPPQRAHPPHLRRAREFRHRLWRCDPAGRHPRDRTLQTCAGPFSGCEDVARPVEYLDQIRVTIWLHGADVQNWRGSGVEVREVDGADTARHTQEGDERKIVWHEVFSHPSENLHVVAVSRNHIDRIAEHVGSGPQEDRLSIVPNFIDGRIFRYAEKDESQRKRILSVGPYDSGTDASDLTVAGILELSKRPVFVALNFVLVGDGAEFETTTAPIADLLNVTLRKGFLDPAQTAGLHKRAGVLLAPTRTAGDGVAMYEAMASGLVPITTRAAALSELVDPSCGMIVPPADPVALADAIEALYDSPSKFRRLSRNAAERVRRQSSYEQTIAREVALIREGPKKDADG